MLAIAPSVLALALVPQEIEVLVKEGDTLPGGGLVIAVFNAAIADTGDWVASIYLNDWPPFAGSVLIRNGEPNTTLIGRGTPQPASLSAARPTLHCKVSIFKAILTPGSAPE